MNPKLRQALDTLLGNEWGFHYDESTCCITARHSGGGIFDICEILNHDSMPLIDGHLLGYEIARILNERGE
jgi:hypothetical protein